MRYSRAIHAEIFGPFSWLLWMLIRFWCLCVQRTRDRYIFIVFFSRVIFSSAHCKLIESYCVCVSGQTSAIVCCQSIDSSENSYDLFIYYLSTNSQKTPNESGYGCSLSSCSCHRMIFYFLANFVYVFIDTDCGWCDITYSLWMHERTANTSPAHQRTEADENHNFDLLVENCACWSVIIECVFERRTAYRATMWGWRIYSIPLGVDAEFFTSPKICIFIWYL